LPNLLESGFNQAFEVGEDLSASLPGTASSKISNDLANWSIMELDVVIESKPAAICGGFDLPALIAVLEVALCHAVCENPIHDPLGDHKIEIKPLPLASSKK
jgi:hypothetical protein